MSGSSGESLECPTEDAFLAFVGGNLPDAEAGQLERHLDGCEDCREMLAEAGRALLGSLDGAPPAPPEPINPRRLQRVGDRVGRYHIIDVLGRGAKGIVYAAYDPELDRRVAVKLLTADRRLEGSARELEARLIGEAQAMARLSHRNVVAVHDLGTIDGSPQPGSRDGHAGVSDGPARSMIYIARELIEGMTLRSWLQAAPRSWRDILAVFLQAGEGLAAAHEADIVRRDFKPDNLFHPPMHRRSACPEHCGQLVQGRALHIVHPHDRPVRGRRRVEGVAEDRAQLGLVPRV